MIALISGAPSRMIYMLSFALSHQYKMARQQRS